MNDFSQVLTTVCHCDKTPTIPVIFFEIFVFAATLLALDILKQFQNSILKRYFIVAIGIFIFEFFTAPMWHNDHLGEWAYVYQDVSWVLTMGWSTLILSVIVLVDYFFKKRHELEKFLLYLVFLTCIVIFFESLVVNLGIRTYAPEILALVKNHYIPILNIPLEVFYYIPVFTGLVIGFYKYWSYILERRPVVPVKKNKWVRNIILTFIAVLFFELMVNPMVTNAKLPAWSYIYGDISVVMGAFWVFIIWLVTSFIDRFFIQLDLSKRFVLYIITTGAIMIPIEAWLIQNGYRIYSPSVVSNFSGFNTIIFNVPIEVVFAIPLFLSLVISLLRYWQIALDNNK